ncbi:MAG: ATP-dependent Clp protease proteolytic subunit [Chthoniobacter sp.]|uniref:ClpP family protease n=1 Tax=Chthoniobacter sp. TaxID=2510640 RepID=UPI0032ACAAF5
MIRTLHMGMVVAIIFASLVTSGHSEPPASAAPVTTTDEVAALIRERDRLQLENSLRDEKLRQELASTQADLARLKSESDLLKAKADRILAEKKIEIDAAKIEMEELSSSAALENARKAAAQQTQLIELRTRRDRAELEAELATAELTKRQNAFKTTEIDWNMKTAELRAKLAQRDKEEEADSYAEERPVYLKNPVTADGELVLTDRRIALNGLITAATADFVCSRIDYFNNKNKEWPIFIVIDDSPGGSVMAGNKILESMGSSTAPVYVVVKSFAASMAATIATLAPRSYAYPNAVILHHQISNGMMGNLTEQREGLKTLEQWWKRMATPIAAKMGISPEDFVKQMYAHTATGDWQEFADDAVKLKWIDVVVGRCRETAWRKNPDSSTASNGQQVATADRSAASTEKVDAKGHAYMVLPHLNPVDCYYLHNPDGYYRVE